MRMIDCPCGKGVFAPMCAICDQRIVPPEVMRPTCTEPCGLGLRSLDLPPDNQEIS